jgi:hypothetical protein
MGLGVFGIFGDKLFCRFDGNSGFSPLDKGWQSIGPFGKKELFYYKNRQKTDPYGKDDD